MIARGKKVYSLALSANRTLNNREYITSLKRIVENSTLFSVRDPYTAGLLCTFGIDSNSIVQTEDIVFASEELFNSGRAESNQINLVAISPLCYKHRPEEYVAVVNAACEVFHELNSSCRICLIPLRGIDNTDVQFCESLREMLYHPEWVDVACYPADLTDSELFRCDFHISYKYHAALIADVLQIPGLTVLDETHPHYGNKMTHLSELFAYKDGLVTAHELKKKPVDYIKSHALSGKMPTCPPDLHQFESQWLLDACKRIADCV